MRWIKGGLSAAGLAGLATTAVVASTGPAHADTTVDAVLWSNCQAGSSGSISFAATSVNWLDATTLTYNATIGKDCFNNTTVRLVELTAQDNEAPQTFTLGFNITGPIGASKVVTPLRSRPWALQLVNPLGTKIIVQADVSVVLPQGPLSGGRTSYTVTANSVAQRREFVQAMETPGATVTVAGNVNLDLSGLIDVQVAPGVSLLGDRSVNPNGPRLLTKTFPSPLFEIPPSPSESHERVSGIRLDGGASADPFANMGHSDAIGILVRKANVEIDHNEIYSWRGSGVSVNDNEGTGANDLINRSNAGSVRVHDNYIHHDQHPGGEICCGHAAGYGVETSKGAYATVDRNVFDYNRHAMASGGQAGTGYFFFDNLILGNGGVHSRVASTHQIDQHGSDPNDAFESGEAGEYQDVEYNTVWYVKGVALKLRGTPDDKMDVRHNVFSHTHLWPAPNLPGSGDIPGSALQQTEVGLQESDNRTGAPIGGDARSTCDFDGDGVTDTFHATGAGWWFESSQLGGRYVFLHRSNSQGSAIALGQFNGDGLCDVQENGHWVLTDPAVHATPARGYAIAVQNSAGHLETIAPNGTPHEQVDPAMAPGTSPVITAEAEFGFAETFVRSGSGLTLLDSSRPAPLLFSSQLAAGSSPSMALKPTGGLPTGQSYVQAYYLAPSGELARMDGGTAGLKTGFQVAANCNAAVTWNSSGSINKVAVVGTNGFLQQSTNGSAFSSEGVNVAVASGTSPAAAASASDAMIAVNGGNGALLLNRSSDRSVNDTSLSIKAGTSPSITADATGNFVTAYVAPDGTLNVLVPSGTNYPLGQRVANGSSPAIAADNHGGWKIAYTAAETNFLSTFDYTADTNSNHLFHSTTVVSSGTSPSIVFGPR